mmetsp:Transcript_64585/g.189325  ORF Transcript_64585/g.189325 Transcript_64585/m.189325 type:complete len:94 (+) Transcript_64585:110-391(+)
MEPSTCGSQGKLPHVVCFGDAAAAEAAAAPGVTGSLLGVSAACAGEGGRSCGPLCERRRSSEGAFELGRLIAAHGMLPGRMWRYGDVGDCGDS